MKLRTGVEISFTESKTKDFRLKRYDSAKIMLTSAGGMRSKLEIQTFEASRVVSLMQH